MVHSIGSTTLPNSTYPNFRIVQRIDKRNKPSSLRFRIKIEARHVSYQNGVKILRDLQIITARKWLQQQHKIRLILTRLSHRCQKATVVSVPLTRSQSSENVVSSTWPHVRANVRSRPRWVSVRGRTVSFSWEHNTLNMVVSCESASFIVLLLQRNGVHFANRSLHNNRYSHSLEVRCPSGGATGSRQLTVINAAVQRRNVAALLQVLNERQKIAALQAVLIQIVRRSIAGRHHDDALGEQMIE